VDSTGSERGPRGFPDPNPKARVLAAGSRESADNFAEREGEMRGGARVSESDTGTLAERGGEHGRGGGRGGGRGSDGDLWGARGGCRERKFDSFLKLLPFLSSFSCPVPAPMGLLSLSKLYLRLLLG
jgi:hypothetical protein